MTDPSAGDRALRAEDPVISTAATPLRLPPFWRQNPRSWFRQVEAQFHLRHIQSQQSKYFHILAGLPPEIAAELDDMLATVLVERAYDVLKAAILERMEVSERARLQQLLNEEDLGDRKPSQMLHRMRQLLGDSSTEAHLNLSTRNDSTEAKTLLRELFLQRLPQAMRMVLAGSEDLTLDRLASLADRIADYSAPQQQPPTLAATTTSQASRLDRLEQRLEQLTDALQSLTTSHRPRLRRRSASRPSLRRPPSPAAPTPPDATQTGARLCWYHHRFRHRAQHCIPHCILPPNERKVGPKVASSSGTIVIPSRP
ncbi:uncharacterized protein LOC135389252 [Ornithodoros turicata]|uniref:uncharacterized protein LOC135389252 n=1 Tax=Ornithodoros turicata TaxID=34597 RepID=UPI00313A427A